MFNSLKSKLVIPIGGLLVIMVAVIVVFVAIRTTGLSNNLTEERIITVSQVAYAYVNEISELNRWKAMHASQRSQVVRFIQEYNAGADGSFIRRDLLQYINGIIGEYGVDGFVVTDRHGYAILRSHDPGDYGQNLSAAAFVAAALDGRSISVYTSTPALPMGITSGAPVMYDGEIIGVLITNHFLHTEAFVDRISEVFFADVTIFTGTERVATTLRDDAGRRMTGTTIDNQEIIGTVVERGESLITQVEFEGVRQSAYYFPLRGWDGGVIGMFFVGFSNEYAIAQTNTLITLLVVIGAVGLLTALALMFYLIVRSLKPLDKLTQTVSEVTAGNVNVNIDRANIPNDEIGVLSRDVISLVDVIKDIVHDLSNTHEQYIKKGNMRYQINEAKYQNSFKEMVGLVNNLLSSNTEGITGVIEILKLVANGEFDKKIDAATWVGDWLAMPNALTELTDNLKVVSTEIHALVNAAAEKGDLAFQIDESEHSGGWREIMVGLNLVAKAVDAPIAEIKEVMGKMSKGEFSDTQITGAYNGDFKEMSNSVNTMINIFNSYLDEVANLLAAISEGDLTQSITREYIGNFRLLKEPLNKIIETLRRAMGDISASSNAVLDGAKQITSSAMELADGSSAQAVSLEELNTSVELINKQTKEFADNAKEANLLSGKSTDNAQKGNQAMKQMLEAMTGIKNASNNISSIIKTIQDIAFQTNLLSLNASVEAARAGEHGRGFSVVAEEVRNLAVRSQDAAAESTTLIKDSITRVESGSAIAKTTSESLEIIVSNADEVLQLINNIATAASDQAEMVSQISTTLLHTANTVQDNSKFAHEAAATAEELNSQTEVLQDLVKYFKL